MSVVLLVRHGQASFGAAEYDELSERGYAQARILGAALRDRVAELQLIATGSQRRHKQTAEACLDALAAAGHPGPLPPAREIAGFDEFNHDEVIARYDPRYTDRQTLAEDLLSSDDPRRAFQEVFTKAVARWSSGHHDPDYSEPWSAFRRRAWEALGEVCGALGGGQTALVFTSGGPIAAVCQQLLRLDAEETFRLSWALVNGGVTKILHSRHGLRLSTLNEHGHFEGRHRELITYR